MYYSEQRNKTRGFTLLELLIVIAIIAILATILIIVINPVEMLRRARDSQRLSDLASLNTAIALYMVNSPNFNVQGLDGKGNASCKHVANDSWGTTGSGRVYYSYDGTISDTRVGEDNVQPAVVASSSNPSLVDGNGWIPINLGSLSGSSPISRLPLDPINSISNVGDIRNTDFVYRYACGTNPTSFELNAKLESDAYTTADPFMVNDGGNNDNLYEIGTNLLILENAVDF